ncbi:MAG: HU family DNA-binding protein [Candidatus Moranbacteria bacterium]|jgi:DNA-binding protein HU-beta|nr:HU family DNA-binding protein [Candidatus Moranbacteria bacterium]
MNKSDVINAVAERTGLHKKDAEGAVDAVIDIITETLQKGDSVAFTGFGTFQVSRRAARDGVNPATGEKIKISAVTVPKFKAGKSLKDAVKK